MPVGHYRGTQMHGVVCTQWMPLKQKVCLVNDAIDGGHDAVFVQAVRPKRILYPCILCWG